MRTPEQNTRFHKLVSLLGIDAETKRALVYEVSEGIQTSSKLLTEFEMQRLINRLQDIYNSMNAAQLKAAEKMRRKIFAIFHELEWEKQNGSLDYARIDTWLMKSGYLHKHIDAYMAPELPQLVSQVEQMLFKSYPHA